MIIFHSAFTTAGKVIKMVAELLTQAADNLSRCDQVLAACLLLVLRSLFCLQNSTCTLRFYLIHFAIRATIEKILLTYTMARSVITATSVGYILLAIAGYNRCNECRQCCKHQMG